MSNALTPVPKHLAKLFEELDPAKARVILAIDATASWQEGWDLASSQTAQMCRAVPGGLDTQLVYFRGEREFKASRWFSDPNALFTAMSGVMCRAGKTQIGRVLKHVHAEDQRNKIAAVILISDNCEEDPDDLYAAARKLNGVPVFMFQEGNDRVAAEVYRTIASVTKGAVAQFDAGAATLLADLLKAVAVFAAGGRKALANEHSAAARLLLTQMK